MIKIILALTLFGSFAGAENKCSFTAFVSDTDPKGLNVRAEPSSKGKILGTLPPQLSEKGGGLKVRVEVEVTASQGAWFKIKNAQENELLLDAIEAKPRPVFKGEGWVSGTKLTIKSQATTGYEKASIKSKALTGLKEVGGFDSDDDVRSFHLVDCKADWVQVQDKRLKKNNRFWLNRICGNQETSCDGI